MHETIVPPPTYEKNIIRVDRLEGLLEVISETSTIPGRDLIPVASNGLKLLISNKGSEIRKKLLLSLIKNVWLKKIGT